MGENSGDEGGKGDKGGNRVVEMRKGHSWPSLCPSLPML